MNHTTGCSNEKYNYGYIKSDFDVANAQMDEATVYYIKLMTLELPGILGKAGFNASKIDLLPIDYDNIDLCQQFNGETLFSAAFKNNYFTQAIGILKYIEPLLKTSEKDPDNLNHRYSLYNILKLDDKNVIQKLEELRPYYHKGLFEDQMTGRDFAAAHQNAEIIRRITSLMPLDFNTQSTNRNDESWFGEFIKNKQFNLAEKYLKPYEKQYTSANVLITDLSLNDPQVTCALKEMSCKNPQSIFGRIHTGLKKILPTDIYLKHILHKNRYDLEQENKHPYDSPFERNDSQSNKTPHFISFKMPSTFPSLLSKSELKNTSSTASDAKGDKGYNPDMTLFAWGENQRGGK